MEMVLPIKSTEIDLEEYGRSKHLPLGYRDIIDRGYHFFNPKDKNNLFTLGKELPVLERLAFYLLIGEINLKELNSPDYHFTEVIGFLNAVEKYQYECIKSNSTHLVNDYYIAKMDNNLFLYQKIVRSFKKYKLQ